MDLSGIVWLIAGVLLIVAGLKLPKFFEKNKREKYWASAHGKEMLDMLEDIRSEGKMTEEELEEFKENIYSTSNIFKNSKYF